MGYSVNTQITQMFSLKTVHAYKVFQTLFNTDNVMRAVFLDSMPSLITV